jgi:hypothetical protein
MWRRLWQPLVIVLPWAATVLAVLYITYRLVDPLPPRHLAIAAGAAGSGYDNFARQYARILARDGVELEVRNSAGAVENLDLLRDAASGVQAALATFGVTCGHPLFTRWDIRCSDIHFLQERGARFAICAIPWPAPFRWHAGNRPTIAYLAGSRSY